jgi:ribosome modulation factor
MTSFNPYDIDQRYCGNCHMFLDDMEKTSMTTWHFVPEKVHLLKWFKDSPDTGDPDCICSYCGKVIAEEEMPLRCFRNTEDGRGEELRFHMDCAKLVIVEMAPKPYRDHPAYAEGRAAQAAGTRRGANPYRTGADRSAWWSGWDEAWNKRDGKA